MATVSVSNLQSSFGDMLKKEFGTGIPQISTVVAVVLGSFGGLKGYFDAGAWTVVAVLCFAAVFLYRHQIPSRLLTTTWLVMTFLLLFGTLGAIGFRTLADGKPIVDWEKNNVYLATAYFSFLTTTSIACLITSYRKQVEGRAYPSHIDSAIRNQLFSLDFYKEKVRFDIKAEGVENESLKFVTEYSYAVVNRTDSDRTWDMSYTFKRDMGRVLEAQWDKHHIDLDDPHFVSGVGIRIPRLMKAGQKSTAYFKIEQRFRMRDSETYTSYHPATDLTVSVQNSVNGIRFNFDVLHFSEPEVETDKKKNSKTLSLDSGLLPFQGVILNWTTA